MKNQFGFSILPPTVDLQTWDRWVAKDALKDRRKLVWRSYHQLVHDQGSKQSKLESARTDLANLKSNFKSLNELVTLGQQAVVIKQRDVDRKSTLAANHAGTQVDLVGDTVQSKGHRLSRLAPIEIVDEKHLHLLCHGFSPSAEQLFSGC